MSKALIAVVNARHRVEWRTAVRQTWMPLVPKDRADVFFFVGRGEQEVPGDDVIQLDCDDKYMGLPEKIRSIYRWADAQGDKYHHILKCDDDVVLDPLAMMNSEYEHYAYLGRANRRPTPQVPFWVPMGFNYWVRRDCLQYLVNAPLPDDGTNDDEKWVAYNLHKNGIELQDDQRYKLQYGTITHRPLRPLIKLNRPLRLNPFQDAFPGTFSWCIFLEGNSGDTISVDHKTNEFYKVFRDQVENKYKQQLPN